MLPQASILMLSLKEMKAYIDLGSLMYLAEQFTYEIMLETSNCS